MYRKSDGRSSNARSKSEQSERTSLVVPKTEPEHDVDEEQEIAEGEEGEIEETGKGKKKRNISPELGRVEKESMVVDAEETEAEKGAADGDEEMKDVEGEVVGDGIEQVEEVEEGKVSKFAFTVTSSFLTEETRRLQHMKPLPHLYRSLPSSLLPRRITRLPERNIRTNTPIDPRTVLPPHPPLPLPLPHPHAILARHLSKDVPTQKMIRPSPFLPQQIPSHPRNRVHRVEEEG